MQRAHMIQLFGRNPQLGPICDPDYDDKPRLVGASQAAATHKDQLQDRQVTLYLVGRDVLLVLIPLTALVTQQILENLLT